MPNMGIRSGQVCKISMHHSPAEIEGEKICIHCGVVTEKIEVQSVDDWKTHNVKSIANPKIINYALRLTQNLHLPQYALDTITQISSKLIEQGISKKKSLFFATVYACRVHKIPRLLADIFFELGKITDAPKTMSEKSLLKILNRIAKTAYKKNLYIQPPDKTYYLQAYLAKIQNLIETNASPKYFTAVRMRSEKIIHSMYFDPSTCAIEAILQNVSRTFRPKIKEILK